MEALVALTKIRRFSRFYRPHWRLFSLDFSCAVIIAAMGLVFPIAVRRIIDSVLPSGNLRALLFWGAGLAGMYLLYYLLQYIVDYWGHVVGIRIEKDMRTRLFAHIHRLPFQFFDNNKTGQLMSRVVNDLNEISELAHHGPEDLFTAAMMFTGAFIVMFRMNVWMTLCILGVIPFIAWFAVVNNGRMHKGFRDLRQELGEINARVEDSLAGVRVVQSFTNEPYEMRKFEQGNAAFTRVKQRAYYIMARFHPGIELFNNLISLGVLILGGYLVYRGRLSYGDLVAFILYIGLVLGPIRKLAGVVEIYQRGMASFGRYCEIMDIDPDIRDREGAADMPRPEGSITFEDVTFSYDNHTEVLRNIRFHIRSGESVALAGPSGGGKTTLCHLIPRFYEPDSGTIRIDGQDIRDVTLVSLRSHIGMVQQDVFLFDGTVRENILYGRPDATETEMITAAVKADADSFVRLLPDGYDTWVGERGVKLSGGQKQRISIARVFLRDPPIVIFDEATSSLDNETESIIQESLYKLSQNRTTLVIAHRLATIRRADRILVLTKDGIAEEGSHEKLLAADGVYARLYRAQC